MKRTLILLSVACVLTLMLGSYTMGDFPLYVNYQGKLTDDQGDPVADGDYQIAFAIYNAPDDGDELWHGGTFAIAVTNGLFSHKLGPIPQYFFSDGATTYLAITVEGEEIDPRTQLVAVPYAFHSLRSDTAFFAYEAYEPDDDWVVTGSDMYSGVPGNVGIGTETPDAKLDVQGKATIGEYNTILSPWGLVVGYANTASGTGSTVLGGKQNKAYGVYSVIAGGDQNKALGSYSFIGGGGPRLPGYPDSNFAAGDFTVICGGMSNEATDSFSIVVGGSENISDGYNSLVGGGYYNRAHGDYSVVVGGGGPDPADSNSAAGAHSFVGGGHGNLANAQGSVVSGGEYNYAETSLSTVAGGGFNQAGGLYSSVGGGSGNHATGSYSVVPGGCGNNVTGAHSLASGYGCTASGTHSFALGTFASATHDGAFIWNDDNGSSASSDRENQFKVAANGGVLFDINSGHYFDFRYDNSPFRVLSTSTGAYLSLAGNWMDASSRELKENFTDVDREELLNKIAKLQITQWNYKSETRDRIHIGPVAEDFKAVFGIGDDEGIATIDEAGIALAAIQELLEKNRTIEEENRELRTIIEDLQNRIERLEESTSD